MLRHLVLFRFKDAAPAETVEELAAAFVALRDAVPGVRSIEWGRDESPEGLARGFTHAFLVTFADAAARDTYLPHPAHQAFVARLGPWLDEALVLDYRPR
jgi:quinol monooxygenase YgiN